MRTPDRAVKEAKRTGTVLSMGAIGPDVISTWRDIKLIGILNHLGAFGGQPRVQALPATNTSTGISIISETALATGAVY